MSRALPLLTERTLPGWERYLEYAAATCWVYEVWDTANRLAYVGIADNFERRWRQHYEKSWWLNEIVVSHVYVFGYRTRNEAQQVEACTINEQCAIYNTKPELTAYRRYLELWSNPDRPTDEFDCIAVKRRYFDGTHEERRNGRWPETEQLSASTSGTTMSSVA